MFQSPNETKKDPMNEIGSTQPSVSSSSPQTSSMQTDDSNNSSSINHDAATAKQDQPSRPPLPPARSPQSSASSPLPSRRDNLNSVRERRHRAALHQAASIEASLGGETVLNGFNLLGVVANPRGTIAYSPSATTASPPRSAATTEAVGAPAATDYFTDTYNTIELTLQQVREQIEYLNISLEEWSRSILEEDLLGHSSQHDIPESQLQELPETMQTLDFSSLQQYLERSGMLADSFQKRQLQRQEDEGIVDDLKSSSRLTSDESVALAIDNNSLDSSADEYSKQELHSILKEIPARFFDDNFDLTDPITFRELLLLPNDGSDANFNSTIYAEGPADVTTMPPVQDWFPLQAQEAFGGFLDKVELALLQQVRSKSAAFLEESVRFAQLQEWIQSLMQRAIHLTTVLHHLQTDLQEPMEVVPAADSARQELSNLLLTLERVNEMLTCKSSIGGFLSAQDDLTAIEQIQYGRKLLTGETAADKRNDQNDTEGGDKDVDEPGIDLSRLLALKTVQSQLDQYESLVVTNLREELVEIFLEWNTKSVSSRYALSPTSQSSVEQQQLIQSNGTHISPKSSSPQQQVQQRVCEIVMALQKCSDAALVQTRTTYSHRLQEMIRMTVRTTVGEFASDTTTGSATTSNKTGSNAASSMTFDRFVDCLDMLFEQLVSMMKSAVGVDKFCVQKEFSFAERQEVGKAAETRNAMTPMEAVVTDAAELCSKSVSELLRSRKEAHSLVSLQDIKVLWDVCMQFTAQLEQLSASAGDKPQHKAVTLRSTLLAQTKLFVERQHESNMSALVAALDSERWSQCEVSADRQAVLTRLCSGRSLQVVTNSTSSTLQAKQLNRTKAGNTSSDDTVTTVGGGYDEKRPDAEVEGTHYKVVWSCLLLLEMVTADIACAAHFNSLTSNVVGKVCELLRLFNSRTTQLVLGAGAIHSAARLKSINAKHLSLVTQCLGIVVAVLPHVRAALQAHMPAKQHKLLSDFDKIKKDYLEHNEKVLNKCVSIIGRIVEHGLAPTMIALADFDKRGAQLSTEEPLQCCKFLEGVSTNTRKLHQVMSSLLPEQHLQDVFSRIFAFVDHKVPSLYIAAAAENTGGISINSNTHNQKRPSPPANQKKPTFSFPTTVKGKERMLLEVESTTKKLNSLPGVQPWDFTAVQVLEKKLEYILRPPEEGLHSEAKIDESGAENDKNMEAQSSITENSIAASEDDKQKHGDAASESNKPLKEETATTPEASPTESAAAVGSKSAEKTEETGATLGDSGLAIAESAEVAEHESTEEKVPKVNVKNDVTREEAETIADNG